MQRERYKDHWVDKVLRREKEDFFPDHSSLYKLFG